MSHKQIDLGLKWKKWHLQRLLSAKSQLNQEDCVNSEAEPWQWLALIKWLPSCQERKHLQLKKDPPLVWPTKCKHTIHSKGNETSPLDGKMITVEENGNHGSFKSSNATSHWSRLHRASCAKRSSVTMKQTGASLRTSTGSIQNHTHLPSKTGHAVDQSCLTPILTQPTAYLITMQSWENKENKIIGTSDLLVGYYAEANGSTKCWSWQKLKFLVTRITAAGTKPATSCIPVKTLFSSVQATWSCQNVGSFNTLSISIYIFIYLFIHLFILYLFTYLSIYLFTYLSIYLFIYLYILC